MTISFTLKPRRILLIWLVTAAVLCFLSFSLRAMEWNLKTSNYVVYSLSALFNVTYEANIPTLFSILNLLLAALLLLAITRIQFRERDGLRGFWLVLTVIFAYLMIDEAAEIHEIFSVPLQESLNLEGVFYFGWVLVGFAFVVVVGIPYLYFLIKQPRDTQLLFVLAGALFVGGALGLELIGSQLWFENDGVTTLTYSAFGAAEEFLEMSGVIVFNYALMRILAAKSAAVEVGFAPQNAASA